MGLHDEECCRAQQRYRDVKELADACSTVDLSCLIVVSRDLLKTGDEEYHVVTDD